jgi:hypothetical protein
MYREMKQVCLLPDFPQSKLFGNVEENLETDIKGLCMVHMFLFSSAATLSCRK